ncbi:tRNA pseudouridine(55) synthase TruB [Planococcaceae bacterium Storch 2/2-2]|nr:tRNA pseudouridine(55) synthase TruB [Planococcaceae bacterium Storch 2/2-2]
MYHGILPVWKERGMTSHDVVYKVRKIIGMKKVGHTGTLDPSVEGVLPICLGQATKIASLITDAGKEYVARVSIGRTTETEDSDGETVDIDRTWKKVTREQLLEAIAPLIGEIEQTPPMYSAVRVNGKRLYEYAREGIPVERPTRRVQIDEIELLDDRAVWEGEELTFDIRIACGKGTYIRTLAVAIGQALGYPAHMASLVRTRSASFEQKDCVTLDELQTYAEQDRVRDVLLPLEDALSDFPFVELDESLHEKIRNGQVLPLDETVAERGTTVFTIGGKALAMYNVHPTKPTLMKPEKMFPFNE